MTCNVPWYWTANAFLSCNAGFLRFDTGFAQSCGPRGANAVGARTADAMRGSEAGDGSGADGSGALLVRDEEETEDRSQYFFASRSKHT
jgi:hypothetical protein